MFSTKGRYALRVMIYLAEHADKDHVKASEIAGSEGLSESYIENILAPVVRAKLLHGLRGKYGGGYKLVKPPSDYTLTEILLAAGETLAPVACLRDGAVICGRAAHCRVFSVWKEFHELTLEFFGNKTLADLMLR